MFTNKTGGSGVIAVLEGLNTLQVYFVKY